VAREKVKDKNRDRNSGSPDSGSTEPGSTAESGSSDKPVEEPAAAPGSRSAGGSGTAAAAAAARGVMQRRHRRLGFAMTAAVGVELAGAAGLVLAGLLPWEWGERLWGRTDTGGLAMQVAIALTVLALVPGWLPARSARADRLRPRSRTAALLPATVVLAGAVTMIWQAPTGSRGSGAVVAGLAAVLVLAGAAGWLAGLSQLRLLFPFGLQDARTGGYGNLPAVRRAMLIGGPAGAVGGIVLVAGAVLIVPGLVTTEDASTAGTLALAGEPPAVGDAPAWELTAAGSNSASIRATPGGLVVDGPDGVQVVDPRDGTTRWHWRDGAYQRVASVVTDGGTTVVLALRYEGELTGRDRVVALDTATGEIRWDRFDAALVEAMGLVAVAPQDGDWFVVPEQGVAPQGQQAPVTLRAVDSDGNTRWRVGQAEGCSLTSVNADAGAVVVISEDCADPDTGAAGCRVRGLDPATGEEAWSWPPAGREDPVAGCQPTPRPELVLVTYQAGSESAAAGLDPASGEEDWSVTGEVAGLSSPTVSGDTVLGVRPDDTGQNALLVLRNLADGQVREEVRLPAGQPVGIEPTQDGFAAISHYRPDSAEVVLLEVDVTAGTVTAETVVAAAPTDAAFQRLSIAAGPETLAMVALLAAGPEPGSEDLTLLVHGFG